MSEDRSRYFVNVRQYPDPENPRSAVMTPIAVSNLDELKSKLSVRNDFRFLHHLMTEAGLAMSIMVGSSTAPQGSINRIGLTTAPCGVRCAGPLSALVVRSETRSR